MIDGERMGATQVVRLKGDIDLANAAEVERRAIAQLGGAAAAVLDLTEVTYFDSSGMRMLDGLAGACESAGLPLRVVAPDPGPARLVLRICAWPEELLTVTVDEAVASLT